MSNPAPYKPARKVYELVFEEFPGLEVIASGTSMGVLLDVSQTKTDLKSMTDAQQTKVFQVLADSLITWNIVHPDIPASLDSCPRCGLEADMPLPTTHLGMMCLDMEILTAIVWGWIGAMSRVALPKGISSSLGNNEMMSNMMKQLGELQNQSKLPTPNLSLD